MNRQVPGVKFSPCDLSVLYDTILIAIKLTLKPFYFLWLLITVFLLSCEEKNKPAKTGVAMPGTVLFTEDHILNLTLTADLKTVLNDRGEDRRFHPAQLSYTDPAGKTIVLDVEVKTRGKFRRDIEICDLPPLSIKFNKEQVKNTLFEGQEKLKLVTHCQQKDTVFQQYLLEEYLVYRMYNLLTEYSFRARLASIRYADSTGGVLPGYAFFIEDDDKMAERNGGKILKTKGIAQDSTNHVMMTQVAVFQYMIGNVDWSVTNLHNIKLVQVPGQLPVVVPYDFDHAGLIAPPYAIPDPELYIESVKERLYRGYCRSEEELELIFGDFRQRRKAFYALHQQLAPLGRHYVNENLAYLDEFYKTIGDSARIRKEFVERCREKSRN